MRINHPLCRVLLALAFLISLCHAQHFERQLDFNHKLYNFAADDIHQSRLLIQVSFAIGQLRFAGNDSTSRARYQLDIAVHDEHGSEVAGDEFSREFNKGDLLPADLQSAQQHHATSFDLPPGNYHTTLKLRDVNSQRVQIEEIEKELKGFSPLACKFEISDLAFVDDRAQDSTKKFLVEPYSMETFVSPGQKLFTYLEFFQHSSSSPLQVRQVVRNRRQKVILDQQRTWPICRNPEKLVLPIWTDYLPYGVYEVELELTFGELRKSARRSFRVVFDDMPTSAVHIQQAIERALLSSEGSETAKLELAAEKGSIAQKRRVLQAFWQARLDTSALSMQQLMAAYYNRFEVADDRFGALQEGWKTDPGRIYVKYGPPDLIDLAGNQDEGIPLQVWHYFDLDRKFTFVDPSRAGDYLLAGSYWQE